ncbi:hypothetical protein P7C73_g6003, partial [Tremellales sp. Uapishka_1]
MTTSNTLLPLLLTLPVSSPALLTLLQTHKPLSSPSHLPIQTLTKFLNRINAAILNREDVESRKSACEVGRLILDMDGEGWALMSYGKGWIGSCLGGVSSASTPLATIPPLLSLLTTIVKTSPRYPSFERESVHPIMGKLGIHLGRVVEKSLTESEYPVLLSTLQALLILIPHSPAPFRPLIQSLKPHLVQIILGLVATPREVRDEATDVLACLHLTLGKAASGQGWGNDMKEALAGVGGAISGICGDGFQEDPIRVQPPPLVSSHPLLPQDPAVRLPLAVDFLEGWTELALALLRFPTSRPVPVPIAQLVSAGLRCLSLTLDTPTVAYVSPQHHAALLAVLPRIWTAGTLLLGAVAAACGDHLFPHLAAILDHSVWLAERLPAAMTRSHFQLLNFHNLFLTLYPPALLPLEYPTRILRLCLSSYSPLLDSRPLPVAVGTGGGKRGKKRARGAEDGLVGGLEGRENKSLTNDSGEVIRASLKLASILHSTPLVSPSLMTFSIRLHLTLHLSLPSLPDSTFPDPLLLNRLRDSVREVLENAVLSVEGEQGTGRGWKSVILSVLPSTSSAVSLLLHPSLPPLHTPQPPLSSLHFFAKEDEEEKRIRLEMGFQTTEDVDEEAKDLAAPSHPEPAQISHEVPPPVETQPASETIRAGPAPTITSSGTIPVNLVRAEETVAFMQFGGAGGQKASVAEAVVETLEVEMKTREDSEELPELDSGSDDDMLDGEEEEEEEE